MTQVPVGAADAPRHEPAAPRDAGTWGERLRRMTADIARVSSEQVGLDTPLKELGFDSSMLTELRLRTEAVVGRTIPATVLWSHPTIAAFATYLVSAREAGAGNDTPPRGRTAPSANHGVRMPDDSELDSLSEEQATQMLAELVRQLEERDG
jgi:epothilone polyketide synthase D